MKQEISRVQIQSWRTVPLSSVVRVANATCKGANFQGCSKTDIYNDFRKGIDWSCKMDVAEFVRMMNALVRVHEKLNNDRYVAVDSVINSKP